MKTKIGVYLVFMIMLIASTSMITATTDAENLNSEAVTSYSQGDTTLITELDSWEVNEYNENGTVIWSSYRLSPMDAERLENGNTLIADAGYDGVIEVDTDGDIVWEKTGLNSPADAERLQNGNTLITDTGNNRVIEVNTDGDIIWQKTGLNLPVDSERLQNGNTLITEEGNNSVIEINTNEDIVWQKIGLSDPFDAERLENGNTLIADAGNSRVIEVDTDGDIVWEKTGLNSPADAERLQNGNTLITDTGNNRVIEINTTGDIIWEKTDLNFPIDAERITYEPPEVNLSISISNTISIGKICANINNTGELDVSNVYWEINLTAGLLKKSYFANGTIESIMTNEMETVCTGNSFGRTAIKLRFGGVSGYVLAKLEGFETKIEFSGFVFGRIIIITEYGPPEE